MITKGEVVRLKSGGPCMTVNALVRRGVAGENLYAMCVWFEKGIKKEDQFLVEALTKIKHQKADMDISLLPPKPPCPPGREINEFFGETKASKLRQKKYEDDHKEWKKKIKEYQKRRMTTIERIEKGIR